MQKTPIEWTDYSWNPIRGICPVGCWYCYARRIYKRFKLNPELRIEEIRYCPQKPSKIFVCSTIELFHPAISKKWRDIIFEFIEDCPQHTFQILTKFPQNIDRSMPPNVWLGVTVTNNDDVLERYQGLLDAKAKVKFISYEPILSWINYFPLQIDWLIAGKLTGHGKKYDPDKRYIKTLVSKARKENIPIFLKDNLKEIWEGPLIQEMPE